MPVPATPSPSPSPLPSPSSWRGWRGRIGFLWPADGLNDDEFWAYLPDGVALLTARFSAADDATLDVEQLDQFAALEPLAAAAQLLKVTRPNVLALGDHAGSFIRGAGWDVEQLKAIADAGGAPATTMSTATVVALKALGARRPALAAPYSSAVTERCGVFLAGNGLAPVNTVALDLRSEWDIGLAPPERWYDLACRADHAEADAILLAGGGIRSAAILNALEADLGKPVVNGPGALIWHAARLLGVDASRGDRGRLFRERGNHALR